MGCSGSSDTGPLYERTLMLGVPSTWAGVKEDAIFDWLFAFMMSSDMLDVVIRAAQPKGTKVTDLKVLPVPGGLISNWAARLPGQVVAQKNSQLQEFSRVGNCVTVTVYYMQPGTFQGYVQEPETIKAKLLMSNTTVYRATMSPDGKIAVAVIVGSIAVYSRTPGLGMMIKLLKPMIKASCERSMKAVEATFAKQQDMPAPIDINGTLVLPIAKADLPVAQGVVLSPVPDAQMVEAKVVKIIEPDSQPLNQN